MPSPELDVVGRRSEGSGPPSMWRSGPFPRLWAASIASNVGTQMNNVAKAWLLFQLTHSAVALGIEGLCFSAPMAVLPLAAGRLADRFDRRRLVLCTLLIEAAQAAALAGLAGAGAVQPWVLYVAAGLDAARLSVNMPAQSSLVADLMSPEQLPRAIAVSSTTWSSSALVGPAAGGALLAATGAASVFGLNAAMTIVALLAIASLRPRPAEALTSSASNVSGLFGYLRHEPHVVRYAVALTVAMVGVLGVETLLPIFSASVWHTGAVGYGLLRTAPGVAAVITGLVFSARRRPGQRQRLKCTGRRPRPKSGDRVVALALCAAAAGLAAFATAPLFTVALVVLAATSASFSTVQIRAGVDLQLAIPEKLRGRVNALVAFGQSGLGGISAVATAALASEVGAIRAIDALAAFVAAFGLTALLRAALRQATKR